MKNHSNLISKFSKTFVFLTMLCVVPFVANADTHTVTFHVHGAVGQQSTERGSIAARLNDWNGEFINSGDKIADSTTIRFEANPEPGFRVRSWYRNGSVVTNMIITNIYTLADITADVVVAVEFEEATHSVTFNVVDGKGGRLIAEVDGVEVQSIARVREDKSIVFTAIPDPGYRVRRWQNGSFWENDTNTVLTISNLTGNRTIRVEFEGLPYEIIVEDGTLENGKTNDTVVTGTILTITANTPEEGMQFANWEFFSTEVTFVDDTDETTTIAKFIMPGEDVSVKAIFEPIPPIHTVTFNTQGGSAVAEQTIEHGEKIEKPTDPTRTNFTFAGWYSDSTHTNAWNFETDIVTSDTTLFAKWTADATNIVEMLYATPLQAWITNDVLHIKGIGTNQCYRIYTISGTLIYQGIANNDTTEITLPIRGMYIIQLENRSLKIAY